MLTPFGQAMRKLRIDRNLKLMDVAKALGVSSAFVSAVEAGRKPIPDGFVIELRRALKLKEDEVKALRRAADRTRKEVRVDSLAGDQRELVAAFARTLDNLPEELLRRIKAEVLKSLAGETPFLRKRRGIVVPPMSGAAIKEFADKVRSVFVHDSQVMFPIIDVLEFRLSAIIDGFYLEVRDKAEMGELEGVVLAGRNGLCLREDVYDDACAGDGRARFTATHELGHFLMHRNVTMARIRDDNIPIYCDAEWQADRFAGALMMSHRHWRTFLSPMQAAQQCGMSQAAAKYQLTLHRRDDV
jgi:transcriptional regulator with XRE-family HTH domain